MAVRPYTGGIACTLTLALDGPSGWHKACPYTGGIGPSQHWRACRLCLSFKHFKKPFTETNCYTIT